MADSKWNGASYPDGGKNLPDNRVGLAENFQYIETELSDDHYWIDDTSNKNGHHKHVAMPQVVADTAVPDGTDGIIYNKKVTDYDATKVGTIDKRIAHYAEKNSEGDTIIRPMSWGTVWAFVVFNPKISDGTTTGIVNSSNVASISYDGDATKTWTITFTTASSSVNYMVFGSATTDNDAGSDVETVRRYGWNAASTLVGSFKVQIYGDGGSALKQSTAETTQAYVMVML